MVPAQKSRLTLTLLFLLALPLAVVLLIRYGESWLRHALLYLSHAAWARSLVSRLPLAQRVAARFVAGETLGDAMRVTRELNAKGMYVTMDFLGESVTNEQEAIAARDEILRLLSRIGEEGVDANVSVKLSQLGLKIDGNLALDNMCILLERARETGNRIRIDMEESAVVDETLDIYRTLRQRSGFDNVGVVVQAYLYRTEEDLRQLIAEGAWVRLCKGAYMEPPEIAFPDKADTDRNFIKLMKMLLGEASLSKKSYPGIATHDENMIAATRAHVADHDISSDAFEFQMLYGVRRELQESLVKQGYHVRVYVPYGTAWYPYFVRRLAERPANLWFFVSNYFRA